MNNKGFGKFEVLTVIVLLSVIITVLLLMILKAANNQRLNLMVTDAKNFSNHIIADNNGNGVYYLRDAINDELFDNIKSPFSSNYCDTDESKVEFNGSEKYVTLKCDEYLIFNEISTNKEYSIYTVSEWLSSKKSSKYQKIVGYNCKKDGKNIYKTYYEEKNFLNHINETYAKNYMDVESITDCQVESKELYRSLKLVR